MKHKTFFKLLRHANDDCECEHGHQPRWLSLALAILPAILPVLIDKLGDMLMRWLFEDKDEETDSDDGENEEGN